MTKCRFESDYKNVLLKLMINSIFLIVYRLYIYRIHTKFDNSVDLYMEGEGEGGCLFRMNIKLNYDTGKKTLSTNKTCRLKSVY